MRVPITHNAALSVRGTAQVWSRAVRAGVVAIACEQAGSCGCGVLFGGALHQLRPHRLQQRQHQQGSFVRTGARRGGEATAGVCPTLGVGLRVFATRAKI